MEELLDLANEHAPSIVKLLFQLRASKHLENGKMKCPPEWSEFIRCLCSTSPVCAMIHPSEKLLNFLRKEITEKILQSPSAMQFLQEEFPVLFNLLKKIKYVPESLLSPVICALLDKALAPFTVQDENYDLTEVSAIQEHQHKLSYFPQLSVVRCRSNYSVDKQPKGCTKLSSKHPTLLPGIFTVFCHHGNINFNRVEMS